VPRALRRAHLVKVAHALASELGLDRDGLRSLRVPVDLLDAFPAWREGSARGFKPRSLGLTLTPESAGRPIGAIRLQLSTTAGAVPVAITLLAELRRRFDDSTRLVVLIDPNADRRLLQRAAGDALGAGSGVRFVSADFNTIYARDNALAAVDGSGRPVLLVPRMFRDPRSGDEPPLDRRAVSRPLKLRVVSSRFHWQGGNILYDGETLAIGADAIAENAARLGLTADEVTRGLEAEFGKTLTVLGDPTVGRLDEKGNRLTRSGQASYHIDLDVALLGRTGRSSPPVALVADGRQALKLLPSLIAGRRLPRPPYLAASRARARMMHEYQTAARLRAPRLDAYRDTLRRQGYRIIDMPELRTRDVHEDVTGLQSIVYCNVVPGSNRGRAAVHYLPWDIPVLDALAERGYAEAGVKTVRVTRTAYLATQMMERAAGLRCFCGVMP
jgi:hypothetical protein